MTFQDLAEKLRRYPIPSACGLIVFVCFFAFYLRMNLLTDLDIENGAVQSQVDQVEKNVQDGRTLSADLEKMKAAMATFDTRVIRPAELADNLKYFYELEAATQTSIADLRQSIPAPVKGAPKAILSPVEYSVIVNGRFDQVISYISELERGRHFYRLKGVSIQRGRDEPGKVGGTPLVMSLNLELLGWP